MDYPFAVMMKILSEPTPQEKEAAMKHVINVGLSAKMMGAVRDKQFEFILNHWKKYGVILDKKTFFKRYEKEEDLDTPEPLPYYAEEVKESFVYRQLVKARDTIEEDLAVKSSESVAKDLLEILRKSLISVRPMEDVDFSSTIDTRLSAYQNKVGNTGAIMGIPSGITFIDNAAKGWQAGDLIFIHGRPESFKTYLTVFMALKAWDAGFRVLYITREMSPMRLLARVDSLATGVNSNVVRHGFEKDVDFKAFAGKLSAFKGKHEFIISGTIGAEFTVEAVQAKIKETRPNLVFVDGVYMMTVPGLRGGDWERIQYLTRNLKQCAMNENTTIIGTTQSRRGNTLQGFSGDNVGYGDSFLQDADVMFNIGRIWDKTYNKYSNIQWVKWDKFREDAVGDNFYLHWDFDKMLPVPSLDATIAFGEEDVSGEDIEEPDWMKEFDDDEDEF